MLHKYGILYTVCRPVTLCFVIASCKLKFHKHNEYYELEHELEYFLCVNWITSCNGIVMKCNRVTVIFGNGLSSIRCKV